jgi:hypothetical protein
MSNDKLKTPEDLRHSTGVMTETNADKETLLKELFSGFNEASKREKAVVNHNFSATEGERREPHSALLQKNAEDLRSSPTLKEAIRGILK